MVDNRIEFDTGLEFSQAEVRDPPLPLPLPQLGITMFAFTS